MGCRQVRPASELIRIVRLPGGALVPGQPGRGGRGAWLCPDRADCLEGAVRGGFGRAFRTAIPGEAAGALRAMMAERGRLVVRAERELETPEPKRM